jgi:antitoxin component of RelBE/YafQ-DinJ toxin-antitoxin module
MGKPVSSNVPRVATTALNTKINKEVFTSFKDCCAELGYPMNVMLETFMRQYANGRFDLSEEDVLKFKNDGKEVDILNTTFNKEIYHEFKIACKKNGYFIKHVITAFMEKLAEKDLILEYRKIEKN